MKEWQRTLTTRRSINPPKSERIVTLWREGKITVGEEKFAKGPREIPYEEVDGFGLWLLCGDDMHAFDFRKAENIITESGAPIHGVSFTEDGLTYTLSAFCNTERSSTAFIKLTVTNDTDANLCGKVGFIIRSELEKELVVGAPDLYNVYSTDLDAWKNIPSDITEKNGAYISANGFVTACDALTLDTDSGIVKADFNLSAGENVSFTLTAGRGEPVFGDYDRELPAVEAFWECELAKLTKLPEKLKTDAYAYKLCRHLTAFILQSVSYPVGEDFAVMRQGCLQRRIWPGEAFCALEALATVGDFDEYIEPVIDAYFNVMQTDSGEFMPLGIEWAMVTANCLYSFGDFALHKDKAYYEKYRDRAIMGFKWMRETRNSSHDSETEIAGLFPPKRSCDSPLVFQAWTLTDTSNILGLEKLLAAAKKYGDPKADEIEAETEAYRAVIRNCFDKAEKASNGGDIDLTTFVHGMPGDETKFHFAPSVQLVMKVLSLDEDKVKRILAPIYKRGQIHEGLYWRMPMHHRCLDPDGVMRVWYVTFAEENYFDVFMRLGMRDKAREILECTYKYAMTDEFIMFERYHYREPYFAPWMPNTSANGRFLGMLCKYCK